MRISFLFLSIYATLRRPLRFRGIGCGLLLLLFSAAPSPAGETWKGSHAADLVLGQADFTSGDDNRGGAAGAGTLDDPRDVAVDPVSGKVFVCERRNHRVLRYPSMNSLVNGHDAEAVLGQPDLTTTSPGTTAAKMRFPRGATVSQGGSLWVADTTNDRVLRFDNAAAKVSGADADGVLGQPDFVTGSSGTTQNTMNGPTGVAMYGKILWVVDRDNHRVLRFDDAAAKANGANADGVLGQADFTSGNSATSSTRMYHPYGAVSDSAGRLWVAEETNDRVIRFDAAHQKVNGAAADAVLGQPDFDGSDFGVSPSEMDSPTSVALDAEGTLWVGDRDNHRLLRFGNPVQKANGADADGVIGQEDLNSNTSGTTAMKLFLPYGIVFDPQNALWVADSGNNRVLRFDKNRFQPDNWIGTKAGKQKGNDIYNASGAGQIAKVKMKGNRAGKTFVTVQNDGNTTDDVTVKGTRGNKKLNVTYLDAVLGNVTGAMTRGGHGINGLTAGATRSIRAKIKGTRKSRGRRAGRNLRITTSSQTDGERDGARAKVKKTP